MTFRYLKTLLSFDDQQENGLFLNQVFNRPPVLSGTLLNILKSCEMLLRSSDQPQNGLCSNQVTYWRWSLLLLALHVTTVNISGE